MYFVCQADTPVLTHPSIWTAKQFEEHCQKNTWLGSKHGRLGCKACAEVMHTPVLLRRANSTTYRMAAGWGNYDMTYSGSDRKAQLTSLRKKIWLHQKTNAHLLAVKIVQQASESIITQSINKISNRAMDTTKRCFRTAYKMAKEGRPFVDYPEDVCLQELNGADMGRILHSNVTAKSMIDFISAEMKSALLSDFVLSDKKFSVLLDESTSLSVTSTLIVYIRGCFGEDEQPVTVLLDLVPLTSGTAAGIRDALYAVLAGYGFTAEVLGRRWLGLTTDGCSAMLGRSNGLHALVKRSYPSIISWHCSAHRLELGVSDGLKSINSINHFKVFLEKVHNVYSMSPKNQHQLEEISKELGEQLLKVGKIFTIRWVASSMRTVRAVWESFDALAAHFEAVSQDRSRSQTERVTFEGLHDYLTSVDFVTSMALMLDVLSELSFLSTSLQANNITIYQAHKKLTMTCTTLENLKDKPGRHERAIESKFQNYPLKARVRGANPIPKAQFIQALLDNLNRRMFRAPEGVEDVSYDRIVEASRVLSPCSWTPEEAADPSFGDDQILDLVTILRLGEGHKAVGDFRDFVTSGGKGNSIEYLASAVATIPISSAECERGFRAMNGIMTKYRASMSTATLASLLFIYCAGPPLTLYDPTNHVKKWIRLGRHSATDANARSKQVIDYTMHPYHSVWRIMGK